MKTGHNTKDSMNLLLGLLVAVLNSLTVCITESGVVAVMSSALLIYGVVLAMVSGLELFISHLEKKWKSENELTYLKHDNTSDKDTGEEDQTCSQNNGDSGRAAGGTS